MLSPIIVYSVLELICGLDVDHILRKLIPNIYHPLRKEVFPQVQALLQLFLEEFKAVTPGSWMVISFFWQESFSLKIHFITKGKYCEWHTTGEL